MGVIRGLSTKLRMGGEGREEVVSERQKAGLEAAARAASAVAAANDDAVAAAAPLLLLVRVRGGVRGSELLLSELLRNRSRRTRVEGEEVKERVRASVLLCLGEALVGLERVVGCLALRFEVLWECLGEVVLPLFVKGEAGALERMGLEEVEAACCVRTLRRVLG